MRDKLSALKVKNLNEPGRFGDGGGLWLQVRNASNKSWVFRYTLHGRARWMGLGPVEDILLTEAREAARDARRLLLQGLDPLEEKQSIKDKAREQREVLTFKETAERYIKAHTPGWKNEKHAAQWGATLAAYAYPKFGHIRVNMIGVGHVTDALEPIWHEKPETASRVRGRIEAVLDYAKARGWRSGENPAQWRGHLEHLFTPRANVAVEHHAALPWKEIRAFMVNLENQAGIGSLALHSPFLPLRELRK